MGRYTGFLGCFIILGICFLISKNYKAINYRLVLTGLLLQFGIAFFVLRTSIGVKLFKIIGNCINNILNGSSKMGSDFVFGILVKQDVLSKVFGNDNSFIFFFNIITSIILISVIVNIMYYFGLMQKIISFIAKIFYKIMGISCVEAVSNVASTFVGQVEAQIMIKPYLKTMTKSELLASMTGSMACISGSVMAIYIGFGIPSEYLLISSMMAAPGALVISKIVYPETESSINKDYFDKIETSRKKKYNNVIDAISKGCSEGLKIALNITSMLVGFMALVSLCNIFLSWIGSFFDINDFSLQYILSKVFLGLAWSIGIPTKDIQTAGYLMGTKLILNEFISFVELRDFLPLGKLSHKTILILSIALCGFANFGSVGIQVGGIGSIAPERIKDLSNLGMKALICGTLTSYLSASIAGIMY